MNSAARGKRGQPLQLSPEQLDQAAIVTPLDVALARLPWEQGAPAAMKDLLDAVLEES